MRIRRSGALRPGLGDHLLDHLLIFEIRMVLEELIPGVDGAGCIAFAFPPHDAEIEQSSRVTGIVGERFFQLRDGSVHVALVEQAGGEIGAGADILRLRRQRFLVSCRNWRSLCMTASSTWSGRGGVGSKSTNSARG